MPKPTRPISARNNQAPGQSRRPAGRKSMMAMMMIVMAIWRASFAIIGLSMRLRVPASPRARSFGLSVSLLQRPRHAMDQTPRLGVDLAVDPARAEMALEGGDGGTSDLVGFVLADFVADPRQCLQSRRGIRRPLQRLGPHPEPGGGQGSPVEQLARVDLAPGCHVGMADDPRAGDRVARHYAAAEFDERRHLRIRKGPVAEVMAGIDELDADGDAVHVALAAPIADARVPGAPALVHQAIDRALLVDQVMAADLRGGVGQAPQSRFRIPHAGVVENDEIGRLASRPRVVIGRGPLDHRLAFLAGADSLRSSASRLSYVSRWPSSSSQRSSAAAMSRRILPSRAAASS